MQFFVIISTFGFRVFQWLSWWWQTPSYVMFHLHHHNQKHIFYFVRWHTILWDDMCWALWKTATRLQDGETQKLWWWGVSIQHFWWACSVFVSCFFPFIHVSLPVQLWADEAVLEGSALRETPLLPNLCPAQQDAGGQEGKAAFTHCGQKGKDVKMSCCYHLRVFRHYCKMVTLWFCC